MEDGARGLAAAGKVDSALLVHKLGEGSAGGGEQRATAGGMLHHHAACFDGSGIASPDVGHLPGEEERTSHVKDRQESPPPATGVLAPCKGKPADESASKGRHEGRPGFLADGGSGVLVAGEAPAPEAPAAAEEEAEEECGRERLKRHRVAMAGRVWIPDSWGQEELLKGWSDCAAVDRSLVPTGLLSAREALVEECRRANSGSRFGRLENQCLST